MDFEALRQEDPAYNNNNNFPISEPLDPQVSEIIRQKKRELQSLQQRTILELEKELDSHSEFGNFNNSKVLATLRGKHIKYEMKSREITLGRSLKDVQVNLSEEGATTKISRKQAAIKLKKDGEFYVTNIGKALLFVNGKPVEKGLKKKLISNSLLEFGTIRLLFEINETLHKQIKGMLQR